jgi:hypothetical protein
MLFIGLILTSSSCSLGVPLPLLLYLRGRGVKESNRVGYNMIPIRTLSLLAYFIDIYIYNHLCLREHVMIIYNLLDGGPSHSESLLGLPSLYGVVSWVPILITHVRSDE